jgi:hypothetical protein
MQRLPRENAIKTPRHILTFCVIAVASEVSDDDDNLEALLDIALQPAR